MSIPNRDTKSAAEKLNDARTAAMIDLMMATTLVKLGHTVVHFTVEEVEAVRQEYQIRRDNVDGAWVLSIRQKTYPAQTEMKYPDPDKPPDTPSHPPKIFDQPK